MARFTFWPALALASFAACQQIGSTPEHHPQLPTQTCSKRHGCVTRKTAVVLDSQWRNLLDVHNGESCITANAKLNKTICPNAKQCGENCALEGADYSSTGVETNGDSVTLHLYEPYHGKLINVQPQVYLLEGKDYALLKLLDQEVSFDVDVSKLPCGLDGAMYLTGMDPSGGRSKLNPAGAEYGTGYCDSQCYDSYNFVNGVANVNYNRGACCNEMDLWEANSRSNQLTAHPCNVTRFYACKGKECSLGDEGPCDRSGCGFNPYGLGAHSFYGLQGTVDTKRPFRVVTQFPAHKGVLKEIRRLYVQDGKIIHNAVIKLKGSTFDSISTKYCEDVAPHFSHHGGLAQMGKALERGMVVVMGIWANLADHNNWLDSGSAGPCTKDQGAPQNIKSKHPDTSLTFSNIKWGDIGSTYHT